jgi:glycosyltransferase involved in cell wall biosynthesis
MRLLFLSNFYPPFELGGMEQLTAEVAATLQARGHSVSILTSCAGVTSADARTNGVTRALFLDADIHYYSVRSFFLKRRAREAANLRQLDQAIDQVRPDVFVVWNMWNLSRGLPFHAEERLPGRVAYYIASTWPMDPDAHEAYWRLPASRPASEWMKRPLRARALAELQSEGCPKPLAFGHTKCVSRYMRDRLTTAGAIPSTAGVLHNGIDPAPFLAASRLDSAERTGPLRLLYFGSLVPIKGVHVAVEALGLLEQRGLGDQIELTILGRGHPDYTARLVERVNELGLSERVRFEDWVSRADVPAMLAQHDVFLFTSTGPEAMARTVMEAMAAGLLVIGSEVGGQTEMLMNGRNSLTFPAGDAERLAAQVRFALEESVLRVALARAGQETVLDGFTLDRMVDNLEAWLETIA